MKITIDRSKWRTGGSSENATGEGVTSLVNEAGYRCCLGFVCSQSRPELRIPERAGAPASVGWLAELSVPGPLGSTQPYRNTQMSVDAVNINDSHYTTPEEKEAALLELFKDSIYELEFVGEYA